MSFAGAGFRETTQIRPENFTAQGSLFLLGLDSQEAWIQGVKDKRKSSGFTLTGALVAVNVAVYIYTSIISGSFLRMSPYVMATYGQLNLLVIRGRYWQLFSSMFIHANLVHLFGNMFFLLVFGLRAEELFNKVTYLTVYFASGLLGNLLSLLLGPLVLSVGASGAIFGLFGACTAYLGAFFGRSITAALIYGFYLLLLNVGAGVNILAHFGGLLAGILIGYTLSKRHKPEFIVMNLL